MESPYDDPRSVDELISAALSEPDEDHAWDAIWVLRWRGTREVFDRSSGLCRSFCPVERKLGAAVLGQLGLPERTFPDPCLGILLAMLEAEQDHGVISSILFALSHLGSPEAIGPAARFRDDADPDVREGVVHAMMGHEDALAIEVLIGLTRDQETSIRDWACFALGTQVEVDTRDLRAALAERLTDEDDDTRCEALVGLARRKDLRVISPLLEALSSKSVWSMEVEAASLIADPRLYPELIALRGWWDVDEERLEEAILACSPHLESCS
ncbi:HEAT repeat domain-containing protein [Singulisphaera sp. Ch08]|uniref:HEAT repeat domain-containing protein n=1 Tax=Singulisphaera sp. Ch08 TaxID=3120278 RepID=A0AAU7CMN2_9BACT